MSAAGHEAGTGGRRAATVKERPHELVRLVTRLIVAQAGMAAAIGLAYSRRHLPSIIITLTLLAALCGLIAVSRSGTYAAWVVMLGFESAFVAFGLLRFFSSRYLGGTLLAIITGAVLLHPAVARAYASVPGRAQPGCGDAARGDDALGEGTPGALGGRAAG